MFRALIVALVLMLAVATPASAQVDDAEIQADLGIAAAYWGASPDCPDGVHVTYDQAFVGADTFARGGGCGIWVGDRFAAESPGGRCQTITHEWGHLLGHGDEAGLPDDPVGVMVSFAQPAACAALDPPPAPAAPELTVAAAPAPVSTPSPKPTGGWKVRRALAIAQTVWHPACGVLTLRFADPAAMSGQVPEEAAGWASAGNCEITLSNQRHWEFEPLCQAVLHESGHAAGMDHIDDRPSIMNSNTILDRAQTTIHGRKIVTWSGLDHRCMNRGRRFLERHGQLQPAGAS